MSDRLKSYPEMLSMPSRVVVAVALFLAVTLMIGWPAYAQDDPVYVRQAHGIEGDELGMINPAGLAFSPETNEFHVVELSPPYPLPARFSDFVAIRPVGDRLGPVRTWATTADPINTAYDAQSSRLLLYQSSSKQLLEMAAGPDGRLDPALATRHDARHFALQSPRGMTIDPVSGDFFFLDSKGPRIVRIAPTPDLGFVDAAIAQADLGIEAMSDLQGLALNPANGHLFVLDRVALALHELTQEGNVVAVRDISPFGLSDPQGMVFAPSSDGTDDPSSMSLYIADSGLGAGQGRPTTSPPSGQIIEFSFDQPAAPAAAGFVASLIQTTHTSLFLPPSPDPTGITYMDSSNKLMMSDSEVNLTPYFSGDNLFRLRLSGELFDTLTTIDFLSSPSRSNEPTGITYNPENEHLFFSDDNVNEVFEMDPGADGLYDTDDDIITFFETDAPGFGSQDPEGIAFSREPIPTLFIADGQDSEVYRVTPGPNGVFDGVSVDDVVTSFDTSGFIIDPEGIEFNPENGHLYVVGHPDTKVAETTTDGALVQIIDVSAANAKRMSGVGVGPGSSDPSEVHIYITDWGFDSVNDGKLYELTLPPPAGSLAIVKEVEPAIAGPGELITYTLSFANDGDEIVSGVTITDIIPVEVTVQGVVSSGVDITDTGAIPPYVWEVQDLAPGEGGDITITATLAALSCGDTFTNTAIITAITGDSDPDDNSSSATVAVDRGVVVTPSGDADSGDPGSDVVYTLSVENTGSCPDTFDVAVSGNVWAVIAQATVGPLAAGADTNVDVTVHLPSDARCGTDYANVTFTSQSGSTVSDSSTLATTANTVYSVTVDPPSNVAFGLPGAVLTHTLWVANTGNCIDTFDVTLIDDDWPTGASAAVGPLGPAMVAGLDVTSTVPADALFGDADTLGVTVASQGNGTVSASSVLTSTVAASFGVLVEPTSDTDSGNPGAEVVYTLWVTNTGNTEDTFDLAIVGAGWPTDAPTEVGPLAPSVGTDVDVVVTVPVDAGCDASDSATITLTSPSDGSASASSVLSTTVNAVYDVTVDPTSSTASGEPSTDVIHTLWVTNTGNCTDTFDVALTGDEWTTEAPPEVGPLPRGTGASVGITVTVPPDALFGDEDTAAVAFTSQGDGSASAGTDLTTSVAAVFGVLVEPSSDAASGDPGAVVVYTLWVTNTGNGSDTFDLTLTGDEWTTEAPPTVGPLAPSVGAIVNFTVTVPSQAPCGDYDAAVVTLTSQGDGSSSDGSVLTTSANAVSALSVLPPSDSASGAQGDDVAYTLWVLNSGNCADTFDGAVSGNAWTTDVPASVGPLAPGLPAEVPVTVTVPVDAQCIDDVATVTFTSQGDGTTSDSSVLTTSAVAFYGVTVEPSSRAASDDPGADVVYTLWVTNTGNCADTFNVQASDYIWATDAPATVGPMPGGMGTGVDITVTVPSGARCGDEDSATIFLTSQGDSTASDASSLTTSANTVAGLAVEPPSNASWDDPGAEVVYTLWVSNTGNCVDTFDLTLNGDEWTTEAPAAVGPLSDGVGSSVGITVTVPACSKGDAADASAVVFTSQNDGTVWETANLTTTANHVAPVALDDTYLLLEDTFRIIGVPGVLGNDDDANCDPLSASLETSAANGTVVLEADGSFIYTPTVNFDGDDIFSYSASDGALSNTATVTLTVISAGDDPIVDAGEPQTSDEGEFVSFAGSFIDPALRIQFADESIHWDFGDGHIVTGTLTPTHQYLDSGLFTVTLTVTDTSGDVGQDSLLMTVLNVSPTVNAGPDLLAVPGVPLSISGDFTDPGLDDTHTIEWDLDDGTIKLDTLAFDHTYDAVGVYTVTLTVIDDDGGEGTDTAVITAEYRTYLPLVFKASAP